jgi:hypothetical protein
MAKIAEWSANFSFDTLDALLGRVVARSGAVTDFHRRAIMDFVRSLKDGDEKPLSFEIRHNGERTSLGLRVFMDDPWAPDVSFFAPPEVIEMIAGEHRKLCDELGM